MHLAIDKMYEAKVDRIEERRRPDKVNIWWSNRNFH